MKAEFHFVWRDGLKVIRPIQFAPNQYVTLGVQDVFMGYVLVQKPVHVALDGMNHKASYVRKRNIEKYLF